MPVFTLQANMTRGELTPLAHARIDTDIYQSALAVARNVITSRFGGVTRIPGTLFNGPTKSNDTKSRMLPFEFRRDQVFAIEVGDLYMRFWTPVGQIYDGLTPYEIVSPYAEQDLPNIKYRQSGDVLYLWCKGHQPRRLQRKSDTDWAITDYAPQDGPYLPINDTPTRLTLSARNTLLPVMTSNTTPSGSVSSSIADANDYYVFDGNPVSVVAKAASTWIVTVDPADGGVVVDKYWMVAPPNAEEHMATSWRFEGSPNGSTWVLLDSRNGEAGWSAGSSRYFTFFNKTAYVQYRFVFTASNGDNNLRIGEIFINRTAASQSPITLTASSTTGINNGNGFSADDIGRSIRVMGGDGHWRWCEVVGFISTTQVTVYVHGHALPDVRPITAWRMGAWSDSSGWPETGAIYEDRLVHARTPTDPLGMWMSRSSSYNDMSVSDPVVADDAIAIRLTGGRMDEIGWLDENRQLMAGTASSLRSIGAADGQVLSTETVRQRAESSIAASYIDPVSVENVSLFLDLYRQRLMETSYSYQQDGYLARELSVVNEHLFLPGVTQLAYVSNPHKLLFALRDDGKLIAFTYDREQKVAGGTLVDLGGVVESICSLPGPDATDLWIIIRREVGGSEVRYVERLAPFYRKDATTKPPVYAACALMYEGALTGALSGFEALSGETVGVWADGVDIGDTTVDFSGNMVLPGGVKASVVVAGKRMSWRVQTLRLTQHGNQDGTGFGRRVKIIEAYVDLFESQGVRAGSLAQVDQIMREEDAAYELDGPAPLYTEIVPLPVDDSWLNNGVFVIEGDSMYPATVRAIILGVEGEP